MKTFILLLSLACAALGQDDVATVAAQQGTNAPSGSACDSVNDSFLKPYWKFDEASGTRVDDKGSNDLTDNNTVTSAAGVIGNAAQFTGANSEFLSLADNPEISVGGTDFWIHFNVYFDSVSGLQALISKWSGAGEYLIYAQDTILRSSVTGGAVLSTHPVTLATATWYSVDVWWVNSTTTLNISINGGTPTTATGSGPSDTGSTLWIGSLDGTTWFFSGRIDEGFLAKRVPTDLERTSLAAPCRPAL